MNSIAPLIAVLSIAFGGQESAEDAVRATISKLGGHIQELPRGGISVRLAGTEANDEALEALKALSDIRILILNQTKVTDAGLKHLESLPSLQVLAIKKTAVTALGLRELSGLKPLIELHLDCEGRSDIDLAVVARIKSLKTLRLDLSDKITATGLTDLARLSQLEDLDITGNALTDELFRSLRKCGGLKKLSLGYTSITDGGFAKTIGDFTRLNYVGLRYCDVGDAGLGAMSAMRTLQNLTMFNCTPTANGILMFSRIRPDCPIFIVPLPKM